MTEGTDYQVVNVENDHRYRDFWQTYHQMTERKGVTVPVAKIEMRRRLTLIGAMLLHKGDVDGLICGTWGTTALHLQYVEQVIGLREGAKTFACMNSLLLPGRQVMVVDTHVNYDPTAEQLAEITTMAAEEMLRLGLRPKAALLSHSNFGSSNQPSAVKMREALALLRERAPWLEVDGEMHGDTALDADYRRALMPDSTLSGEANLLVLLTSVDGLLDAKGRTISRVDDVDSVEKFVRADKGRLSVGGMSTKLQAVRAAVRSPIRS